MLRKIELSDIELFSAIGIFFGSPPVCAPSPRLSGCILFAPPIRTLHNDLLCNVTCSVTWVRITYWGENGKDFFSIVVK